MFAGRAAVLMEFVRTWGKALGRRSRRVGVGGGALESAKWRERVGGLVCGRDAWRRRGGGMSIGGVWVSAAIAGLVSDDVECVLVGCLGGWLGVRTWCWGVGEGCSVV